MIDEAYGAPSDDVDLDLKRGEYVDGREDNQESSSSRECEEKLK